jgi:hypothetical protein
MQTQGGALMPNTLASLSVPDQSLDATGAPQSYPAVAYLKVTLTQAQVQAMHGSAITLIPAPAAGFAINILDAMLGLTVGSAAFGSGGTVEIQQNGINIATTSNALVQSATSIAIQPAFPGIGTTQSNGAAAAAVTITNASGAFTLGAGSTLTAHLWYTVVSLQ